MLKKRIFTIAPHKSTVDGFKGTIISIGPQTDAILNWFKLDDKLIPQLCVLTHQVQNTQWESVLRMPQWGLSYEQASSLSGAMLADLKHAPPQTIQVSIFFNILGHKLADFG
jgi:hypothetical protein